MNGGERRGTPGAFSEFDEKRHSFQLWGFLGGAELALPAALEIFRR
jgi:hypothetical protein